MSAGTGSNLRAADQAASEQSTQPVDGGVKSCPPADKESLEAWVVGMDDSPLQGVVVELRSTEKGFISMKTDSAGQARFTGIDAGAYQLCLSELDSDAWIVMKTEALGADDAASEGDAAWQPAVAAESAAAITHVVEAGECVWKLADRYGFFPGTVWDAPENASLKALRTDMNILAAGDNVVIPAKREKTVDVNAGNSYRIQRQGVPASLRIRFLREGKPRAKVPYLISMRTVDDQVVADRTGTTDTDGFVVEAIPPAASVAEITFGAEGQEEVYELQIGHVDPLDMLGGVRARLSNLGFDTGDDAGEDALGPNTTDALRSFQTARGLTASGTLDSDTRDALKAAFLS